MFDNNPRIQSSLLRSPRSNISSGLGGELNGIYPTPSGNNRSFEHLADSLRCSELARTCVASCICRNHTEPLDSTGFCATLALQSESGSALMAFL